MAAGRSLSRLHGLLALEEEQAQGALESSLAQVRLLENAIASVRSRESVGRRLLALSIHNGEAIDRHAALEEVAAARRSERALRPRLIQAEQAAIRMREQFLAKRVERRQVETLLTEAKAREAAERSRRAQQSLDDWYLGRLNEPDQARSETEDISEFPYRT